MSANDLSGDLNSVIVAAVNGRVEAAVAEALSGDKLIGQYVGAALSQEITVRDGNGYGRDRKTSFLTETIATTVQEVTKAAVTKVILEEKDTIEKAVRAELKKSINKVAEGLVGSVMNAAEKPYGITVEMKYPGGN